MSRFQHVSMLVHRLSMRMSAECIIPGYWFFFQPFSLDWFVCVHHKHILNQWMDHFAGNSRFSIQKVSVFYSFILSWLCPVQSLQVNGSVPEIDGRWSFTAVHHWFSTSLQVEWMVFFKKILRYSFIWCFRTLSNTFLQSVQVVFGLVSYKGPTFFFFSIVFQVFHL